MASRGTQTRTTGWPPEPRPWANLSAESAHTSPGNRALRRTLSLLPPLPPGVVTQGPDVAGGGACRACHPPNLTAPPSWGLQFMGTTVTTGRLRYSRALSTLCLLTEPEETEAPQPVARGPGSEREVLEICRCPLGQETHKGNEVSSWRICGRQEILHKRHVGPKPAGQTFPESSCPAKQLFPCQRLSTAEGRWEGSGSCTPSVCLPWEGGYCGLGS